MLKTILLTAAALLVATPAIAHDNAAFVGPRIEATVGVGDGNLGRDIGYSGTVGADVALGNRFTLGADATANDFLHERNREVGAGARLGYALRDNALVYARGGYINHDFGTNNVDGFNAGGGFNFALTKNLYSNVEYRYTDLGRNLTSHGGRVGLGLRF